MAECRSSLENTRKMSFLPVFNKTSTQVHTESELNVLGVHGKLVKYVVHLSNKKLIKFYFFHTGYPNSDQSVFGLKEF
jgi:hypothetical protein